MSDDLDLTHFPAEHGPRRGESFVLLHGGNMAGWTWAQQVSGMADRHVLTPDLPGYGRRVGVAWPGVAGAADDVAELISSRGVDGRAHVVGLSLGGLVAVQLIHRHPDLVLTCTISGAAVIGYAWWERLLIGVQAPLWHRHWYWAAQAAAFRIPHDSRELFATCASGVSPETNRSMFREVTAGTMPDGEFAYAGPVLAVAAEHDSTSVKRAFDPLRARLPQLTTWVAPGMHHPWNIEDPELFTRMTTTHADSGTWSG